MLLGSSKILSLIRAGVVSGASEGNVGPVSLDLETMGFYERGVLVLEVSLEPGESVFAASNEVAHLPDDLAMRVLIRNSRLRQGLSIDAPLYFPGHSTRVFSRVTNMAAAPLTLDTESPIAQAAFEVVDGCDRPYDGVFANELGFSEDPFRIGRI